MIKIESIIDDSMSFVPEAIEALQRFKALGTTAANPGARLEAMQVLVNELVDAYSLNILIQLFTDLETTRSLEPTTEDAVPIYALFLNSRHLSLITVLHQFAAIKSFITNENPDSFVDRQRFAVNLFRKVYPEQLAKLVMNPQTGFFVRSNRQRDT